MQEPELTPTLSGILAGIAELRAQITAIGELKPKLDELQAKFDTLDYDTTQATLRSLETAVRVVVGGISQKK